MIERLTEVTLVEVLRRQFVEAEPGATGWLAAVGDPALGKCLALIHAEPRRNWTLEALAAGSGLSRSVLAERFEAVLDISPIRYLRNWRLYLASIHLRTTEKGIASIAYDAGYGTEAAFSRAFTRCFGAPPAAWRRATRALGQPAYS